MKKRRKIILNMNQNLSHIKGFEPLNWFSFLVIILLDIFILVNIFNGLSSQHSQIISREEFFPYFLENDLLNKNWSEITKYNDFMQLLNRKHQLDNIEVNKLYSDIQPLVSNLKKILKDKEVNDWLKRRNEYFRDYNSYDNFQKFYFEAPKEVLTKIKNLDAKLSKQSDIQNFFLQAKRLTSQKTKIYKDIKHFQRWYPFKKILLDFVFLIPLLLIFYNWLVYSSNRDKYLQIFISSHLLTVTSIPTIITICIFVYDILPKNLLKMLIHYLTVWNIVAIWYYILSFIAIIVTIFLIYILQKKIFNRKKIIQKRFLRNECIECGKPIRNDEEYCMNCGSSILEICKNCNQKTIKGGEFCKNCGSRLKD